MNVSIEPAKSMQDHYVVVYTYTGGLQTQSPALSEHDLKCLEFALAIRTAMSESKMCTAVEDEHMCAYACDHGSLIQHHCRGCTYRWSNNGEAEGPETT